MSKDFSDYSARCEGPWDRDKEVDETRRQAGQPGREIDGLNTETQTRGQSLGDTSESESLYSPSRINVQEVLLVVFVQRYSHNLCSDTKQKTYGYIRVWLHLLGRCVVNSCERESGTSV